MLSNLASYLGYATPAAKSPLEKAATDVRLRAVEEDEWVLVERNENEGTALAKKDAEEDTEMTRVTLAVSTCPSSLPGSSKGLSRSASLDVLCPLQESWYLTPPPSFTSEGPVHMETSPLENLLIEHPSMSVYEHSQGADTPRKMSNSSPAAAPSSTSPSAVPEEDRPSALLSPIQERMYKLPRKLSKKQSSPPSPSSAESEPEESKPVEGAKEPKIKSFVKSPRRSINSEMQNLPKKPLRKRPEEMISKPPANKEPIREEETPIVPTVQRRLYSEVLASKPKPEPVQTPAEEPKKEKAERKAEAPAEVAAATTPEAPAPPPAPTPAETESAMSVEEESSEEASEGTEGRDRRKAVQTLLDRQHRLHFLNRSAQKAEQRKTCDLMKKNKKFSIQSFRLRRADMMQRHSGANNDRKCAKTFA